MDYYLGDLNWFQLSVDGIVGLICYDDMWWKLCLFVFCFVVKIQIDLILFVMKKMRIEMFVNDDEPKFTKTYTHE